MDQSNNNSKVKTSLCHDDIVISGISGQFPSSSSVDEFKFNLYNKINMVDDSEIRFQHTNPLIPRFSGKIKDINRFDAELFGISKTEANNMDPQERLLLEEAFKAILDAGVNPESLFGSKTGVYIGSSISETEDLIYKNTKDFSYGIMACRKSMFANRLSYAFGLRGPSLLCDTACSSSIYALDLAFSALKDGKIDAAIVGGANVCLHANITLQFALLGVLSATGTCRPFDSEANGYCRSETIGCLFLQRKSAAKRVYATIIGSKTNCDGFKIEGITYPSSVIQEKLLTEIYAKNNIDFNEIGFIEAHSTATIVGDPEECKAIDKAIAQHRSTQLPIGSVKSNCGHAEPAAGVCSLVKVILAMENSIIPPNINFTTMKSTIDGLQSGRLSVVAQPTKLLKPFTGVNSFGFGGANAHVILRQFEKSKNNAFYHNKNYSDLHRLVTWSGRTENAINVFFCDLEKQPLDFEYLALAQASQSGGIKSMKSRGYCLLRAKDENSPPVLLEKKICTSSKRDRFFIWRFGGVSIHWRENAKSLMTLPLFEKSMHKCFQFLEPLGMSLRNILKGEKTFTSSSIANSFIGTTATQMCLIDVLTELSVKPDLIIGESIGELACAYADGKLSAEETIMCSYYFGNEMAKNFHSSDMIALVKTNFSEIKKDSLAKDISVSKMYSKDVCCISGPKSIIKTLISTLKSKKVCAEEFQTAKIDYGCEKSLLLSELKKLISKPKLGSKKWLSTVTSQNELASAEYFIESLQSHVLFDDMFPTTPNETVLVDFGPLILPDWIWEKTSFKNRIDLCSNDNQKGFPHLLDSLGRLYLFGAEIVTAKLYPQVEFPVSRGTRCLSSLIALDHKINYMAYKCDRHVQKSGSRTYQISRDLQQYLIGHEIDGRVLIPATFYLECVWRTLSYINGKPMFENIAVEFEDVKFERATTFPMESIMELMVMIHFGSGRFEVTEGGSLVVSGFTRIIKNGKPAYIIPSDVSQSHVKIHKQDFYKELKIRGYHYNGDFQSVESAQSNGSQGQIKWLQNWVTFIDCMLQISIIAQDSRSLMLPTRLRLLRIYPQFHLSSFQNGDSINVIANNIQRRIVAGGVEIIGLDASAVQRRRIIADPVLEKYQFLPHYPSPKMDLCDVCRCCIQIVLENHPRSHLQVLEIASSNQDYNFIQLLSQAVNDLPLITGSFTMLHKERKYENSSTESDEIISVFMNESQVDITPNLLIVDSCSFDSPQQLIFIENLLENEFLVVRSKTSLQIENHPKLNNFIVVSVFPSLKETFFLLRKQSHKNHNELDYLNITGSATNFDWIETLQKKCKEGKDVILIAQGEKYSGIIGLTNCLRKEPETKNIRCVFIDDESCPDFDINLPLFANQLHRNLAINVFRKGTWGTYRHLKLSEELSTTPHEGHVYGNMNHVGDFSSLQWFQGPLKNETKCIRITYSSLNFKDVMQASGRLPIAVFGKGRLGQTCIFGFEFSGLNTTTGKRVMGMTLQGAVSSHVEESSPLQWEVPLSWTLQDAATVPVVYLTVYYALFYTADIRKGKSILIHAGSGGIGLAAIRVAQAYGLEVFTTVGSPEKRKFLLETFPKLKEGHIGSSRDNSFENMIIQKTSGKGVDFVLNSLSEEKLKTSIRCLKKNGHFLEIGKYDIARDNGIEMGPFMNGLNFSAIFADNLLHADKLLVEDIKRHMSEDINRGIIQPLPATVFQADQIEKAFRYLISGKHVGKVLLKVRKDEFAAVTLPLSVKPQVYFEPDKVYIIPGGLGGFGLELVDWMILRGARKIVLSSSRGITTDYQKLRIKLWQSYGCEILVNTANIASMDGCLELLTISLKKGSVGGIFNLAVILKDSVFPNQSADFFQQSFKPKAFATLYLDQLSRQLCRDLRYFVIFSSVSCGRGNAGQSNYGMANSIMERIIEDRVACGFPGKAVQWGAVGEVGLVADMAANKIDLEIGGTLQQRISSCLEVLDLLLSSPDPIVSSMVVAEKKANTSKQTPLEFTLNTLCIRDIKSISMNAKLSELGLDSLTSVEIRQTFERDYGIILNSSDLRSLTVAKLVEISENAGCENLNVEETHQQDYMQHLRQFYGQIVELLHIKTTFQNISNIKVGAPTIVLPGIDGCGGKIWNAIGEKLSSPAYILQYHKTCGAKSLQEIVQFCAKKIAELLRSQNIQHFKLIGYSFGALVTHFVTLDLEQQGFQGKIVLIDGSPQFIQNLIISLQKVYAGIELEKMALSTMLSLLLPSLDIQTILYDIRNKLFKEEIFRYMHDQLTQHNYSDTNEIMSKIEAIYQRLKIIQSPETFINVGVIDAEVLLLKPNSPTMADLDENYGLSPFTRNQIVSKILEGDHQSILQNPHLPHTINNFLEA